jgi:hypothetical protein
LRPTNQMNMQLHKRLPCHLLLLEIAHERLNAAVARDWLEAVLLLSIVAFVAQLQSAAGIVAQLGSAIIDELEVLWDFRPDLESSAGTSMSGHSACSVTSSESCRPADTFCRFACLNRPDYAIRHARPRGSIPRIAQALASSLISGRFLRAQPE